jgi:RNA polymerase sigma factor (sigma-70 family)
MDVHHANTSSDVEIAEADSNVQRILQVLVPRFCREFPAFQDEARVADALDRAKKRIARGLRRGSVANLHGYAWVTLRHIATSWLRTGSGKLEQHLDGAPSHRVIDRLGATFGTAEEIESNILARELLARLTPDKRRVCLLRSAGFTGFEIAERCRMSPSALNTLLSRARNKLRGLARPRPTSSSRGRIGIISSARSQPSCQPLSRGRFSPPERVQSSTACARDTQGVARATAGHPRSVLSSPVARPDGSPPADSPAPSRSV